MFFLVNENRLHKKTSVYTRIKFHITSHTIHNINTNYKNIIKIHNLECDGFLTQTSHKTEKPVTNGKTRHNNPSQQPVTTEEIILHWLKCVCSWGRGWVRYEMQHKLVNLLELGLIRDWERLKDLAERV